MCKKCQITNEDEKKTCAFSKMLKVIGVFLVIQLIIQSIFLYLKRKGRMREVCNDEREVKEYYIYMNGRKIIEEEKKFIGMTVTATCSGVDIDLTKANILEDSFITIRSMMSGIHIRVPEGINVKLDGVFRFSSSANEVPKQLNEDAPTLYVAARTTMSGISVKPYARVDIEEGIFAE